jgi:hypothetical protein
MNPLLSKHLKSNLAQELVVLKTDWLDTGHVDEILSIVPDLSKKSPCNFALYYGSPALAFALLKENSFEKNKDRIAVEVENIYVDGALFKRVDYSACLQAYSKNPQPIPTAEQERCANFKKANDLYQGIIEANLKIVVDQIKSRTNCPGFRIAPLPQFFASEQNGNFGSPTDKALAVNPNAVNNIAFGNALMIAKQSYAPFSKHVHDALAPVKLELVPVESNLFHFLNGGLHCAVHMSRACSPLTQSVD